MPPPSRLSKVVAAANYSGFVETITQGSGKDGTEMAKLFKELAEGETPADSYALGAQEDVWNAIRRFFTQQATQED